MSNPQWGTRLEQDTIDQLNELIKLKYGDDRKAFIEAALEQLSDKTFGDIHSTVKGIMTFNDAQEVSADRVWINYQMVYKLMGCKHQVNILSYLEAHKSDIEAHHNKVGLGDANKSWNATHRLKYDRTADKENNELLREARLERLKLDIAPYIAV